MIAVIFVSRELFLSNNQTYQPDKAAIKIKAAPRTYTKLIALNQLPLPTSTPTLQPTAVLVSLTPTNEISPSEILTREFPTPTEIILAKAVSVTISPQITPTSEITKIVISEVPQSGFYQILQMSLVISSLVIIFAFVL